MDDFKVGDRVIYKAAAKTTTPELEGVCGTVTRFVDIDEVHVHWDGNVSRMKVLSQNLQHIVSPVPDVITINRADLPEVTESGYSIHCGGSDYFTDLGFGAAKHRQLALQQLAVAEFLEARDKAAEEADRSRAKRRDELADELAPRAYASLGANWYGNVGEPLQKAIDRIIDLEVETK